MTDAVNNDVDLHTNNHDDWQRVPTKRRICGSPNIFQQKRPHHDEDPEMSNRFGSLANDEDDNEESIKTDAQPKPPPIFIPHVENITKMVSDFTKVIPITEFYYKSLKDGQVRVVIKSVEYYRKIIKYLESAGKSYHTFQLKPERAFRVVIKDLHHSTDITDIKAILLSRGHHVRYVRNIISRVTKKPLPMFYVDLDPRPNNKEIYDIDGFEGARIKIEPAKKTDQVVQCFRCQEFGHTKSYCRKPFRCVKCGLDHSSSDCKKATTTPPKCVHCLQNHTASYRGCQFYQNLIKRRTTRAVRTNTTSHINNNENIYEQLNQNHIQNNNMSYSQVARGTAVDENVILQKIETMLQKQIELTNTLINMMSLLMSKICN